MSDGTRGAREMARYWRHPSAPDVGLLHARFVRHVFGQHIHETYTVGVVSHGVEEFARRGTTHRAGPGDVVLVNPGDVHTGQAGSPDGWEYRAFYPPVDLLRELTAEVGTTKGTAAYFPDAVVSDPRAGRLLDAAHRAGERGDQLVASTLLRVALAELVGRHAKPRARHGASVAAGQASVVAARELLHERICDPPSLERLASMVGGSPFALLRAFKRETGLPPHAYLNQVRVLRARELLEGGWDAAEAAAGTGFADQSHLTRHFKRAVGITPGVYARSCKNVQAG